MFVLAYQKEGTDALSYIEIPEGSESAMDSILSRQANIRFRGIELKFSEIMGIFTHEEYERFKRILFEPARGAKTAPPGKKSFLEMGMEEKKKSSLAKRKHK